jgi:hypothetical protein
MARLQMFLSHVHVESRFADFIQSSVERDFIGLVKVYVASDGGILAGKKWLDDLTKALNASDLHAVLCSRNRLPGTGSASKQGRRTFEEFRCSRSVTADSIPISCRCRSAAFQGIRLCAPEGAPMVESGSGAKALDTAIAAALGSNVPDVDFQAYERQLAALEQTYASEHGRLKEGSVDKSDIEIVRNPRVVCISSEQFMQEGFDNQLEVVLQAFPASLRHDRVFDSETLKKTFMTDQVHVVHIAAYVCPRSGDLYFSDVNLGTGDPNRSQPVDRISADALEQLLKMAGTRLVVITGADSMALTATLLGAAHVIAARDMVSPQMLATWVAEFYRMLPTHQLSAALEFAMNASRAPMRLYSKREKSVDLVLQLAGDATGEGAA